MDRLSESEKVDFGCLIGTICRNFKEQISETEEDEFLAKSQKMLEEKLSELEELKTRLSSQLMLLRGELLREVKLGQDNALKEMNTALANLAPQLDGHESWLKGQESRLNCHESRLGDHDSRLNGHESWLHGHESRLDDHDSRFKAHEELFDRHKHRIDEQALRIWDCEYRVKDMLDTENDPGAPHECDYEWQLEDHDRRISELEWKMRGNSK